MTDYVRETLTKATEWLWGSDPEIQGDSFKGPLRALSNHKNDPGAEEKYLHKCLEKIAKDLDEIVFCDLLDCSLVTKDLYRLHLGNFYLEVKRLNAFEDVQSERIKDSFQALCTERMLTCWAQDAVESFYPIFSLSDKEEQIVAAQKWTHHFLIGVRYFDSLERGGPINFDKVLSDYTYRYYITIVMKNFEAYAMKKILDHTESMVKIVCDDKQLEQKILSAASRIHQGLSPEDLKYIEFIENMKDSAACLFSGKISSVERKKSLLLQCAMSGFTLQTFKKSILDDQYSHKMFSDAVSTYQEESLKAFSAICQNFLKDAEK